MVVRNQPEILLTQINYTCLNLIQSLTLKWVASKSSLGSVFSGNQKTFFQKDTLLLGGLGGD